eukprot:scpid56192/ scgid7839/ 
MVFEIDTGAAVTVINERRYHDLASKEQLTLETDDLPSLRTYAGKIIPTVGRVRSETSHGGCKAELVYYVVKGTGPNLLGRDALEKLRINWNQVFNVTDDMPKNILDKCCTCACT